MKPIVKLTGENGNTLNLLMICTKALKKSGQPEKAKELTEKVFSAQNYNQALGYMNEYCEVS